MNPYLPPWEYLPDAEPHVFGERVYVYGSHDRAHGFVFCSEDYVCWSAPVADLSDWRFEGVIYKKTQDPLNADGRMVMYASDCARGPDGRFYIYYVLDKANVVSVAVCDTPAGCYEFFGYVHYDDGTRLGEKAGDEPQFDPSVLVENDAVYLYTGLGIIGDETRRGAMATRLAPDMLTIVAPPVYIAPSGACGGGTSFEGHEFFEAASVRKVRGKYYLVYSSVHMTELCYAVSDRPTEGFVYGGVIVSNCDLGIGDYKPAEMRVYPYGNNHGSIIEICGQWYVFYHRMTNNTWFSRQGCIEKISIDETGRIAQVEMTSHGAGEVFSAVGRFPAYMACNLWNAETAGAIVGAPAGAAAPVAFSAASPAYITQEGFEESADSCYIANITDGTVIGFKYFVFDGGEGEVGESGENSVRKIALTTRAYGRGLFEIRTSPFGEVLGTVSIVSANVWTAFHGEVKIPGGTHALYFTYRGGGTPQMLALEFLRSINPLPT